MISAHFPGKPFNITVTQVYAQTTDAQEAEVDQFYVDPEDFPELAPKKDVLFTIGDWDAKVGSQETPGVTGKFDLGIQNEALGHQSRNDAQLWMCLVVKVKSNAVKNNTA